MELGKRRAGNQRLDRCQSDKRIRNSRPRGRSPDFGESSDLNEALAGSISQSSGWAAAIQELSPSDVQSVSGWAKQDVDPSYASYFTRS